MMTTKIAKKSKIGDYEAARPGDFGARGGGVNPSSREIGEDGVEWMLG